MKKGIVILMAMASISAHAQKQWTLKDCIDYAMKNNITLKQAVLKKESATEDRKQSEAALLPSLTATTNQSLGYSPWMEGVNVKKGSYSGTYGINAQWTVWNGGQNRNTVKSNELAEQQAELSAQETEEERRAWKDDVRGWQDVEGRPGTVDRPACYRRV